MKKKLFKYIFAVIFCLSCLATEVSAEAVCMDKMTILSQHNGEPIDNIKWNVFKIADFQNESYVFSGEFSDCSEQINDSSTSQLQETASSLELYTKVNEIVPFLSATSEEGNVSYKDVPCGMFLITGTPVTIEDTYYMPSPSIITITEDDCIKEELQVVPKFRVMPYSERIFDFSCLIKTTWNDDNSSARPTSIKVILMRNGKKYDTAVLSELNNWSHQWNYLSSEFEWSVIEETVPDNYTVTYKETKLNASNSSEHDIEFTINNTLVTTESTTATTTTATTTTTSILKNTKILPQTGQLWWPVPILSCCGLIIFGIGWFMFSEKRTKK